MRTKWVVGGLLALALLLGSGQAHAQQGTGLTNTVPEFAADTTMAAVEVQIRDDLVTALFQAGAALNPYPGAEAQTNAGVVVALAFAYFDLGFGGQNITEALAVVQAYAMAKVLATVAVSVYLPAAIAALGDAAAAVQQLKLASLSLQIAISQYAILNSQAAADAPLIFDPAQGGMLLFPY
jgi:hypothetical protein